MAELADALDLGSSGKPCRFDPCYPHQKIKHFFGSALFLSNPKDWYVIMRSVYGITVGVFSSD